jgi:hypothetical protein
MPCSLGEHLGSRANVWPMDLDSQIETSNCVFRLLSKLRVDISHPRLLMDTCKVTHHAIM